MESDKLLKDLNWIKVFNTDTAEEREAMDEAIGIIRAVKGIWNDPKKPPETKTRIDIEEGSWYMESEPVLVYVVEDPHRVRTIKLSEENPSHVWPARYWRDDFMGNGYYILGLNEFIPETSGEVKWWMCPPAGNPEEQ